MGIQLLSMSCFRCSKCHVFGHSEASHTEASAPKDVMNSANTEKDTLKEAAVDIPHVTLPSILPFEEIVQNAMMVHAVEQGNYGVLRQVSPVRKSGFSVDIGKDNAMSPKGNTLVMTDVIVSEIVVGSRGLIKSNSSSPKTKAKSSLSNTFAVLESTVHEDGQPVMEMEMDPIPPLLLKNVPALLSLFL